MLLNYFYKYGRVHKMCIGRAPAIVVSDTEIIKQVMVKDFEKFTNRPPVIRPGPPLDSALGLARDEKWRRIRHTLTPTFTAAKLKQIVPIINGACNKLMTKMQNFSETGKSKFSLRCVVLDFIAHHLHLNNINFHKMFVLGIWKSTISKKR